MDKLIIQDLRVQAHIGVRPWEQQVRQPLLLDLELATDASRAAATDALAQALDYGALSRRLTAFVAASRYGLIETLAEQIAALLQQEFGVHWLRLRIRKPLAIPDAAFVAIEIERGR